VSLTSGRGAIDALLTRHTTLRCDRLALAVTLLSVFGYQTMAFLRDETINDPWVRRVFRVKPKSNVVVAYEGKVVEKKSKDTSDVFVETPEEAPQEAAAPAAAAAAPPEASAAGKRRSKARGQQ
jgi:hypothetical protein